MLISKLTWEHIEKDFSLVFGAIITNDFYSPVHMQALQRLHQAALCSLDLWNRPINKREERIGADGT